MASPDEIAAEFLRERIHPFEDKRVELLDPGVAVVGPDSLVVGKTKSRDLVEEHGVVLSAAVHSSDHSTWPFDEEGYKLWFNELDSETVEVTETVERYTLTNG